MEEATAQEETQQLPPVDFISYLTNLVETGQLYLQGVPNPETEEVVINLPIVKHIIDTIEMLEEKTKGNLTAPEANFLTNTLYELRMGYIRVASSQEAAAQQAAAEETEIEAPPNETENVSEPEAQ
ncbi:DUF1844 domain-containing protein [Candidatus Poribacteria bacterium]|nr:DUF1844 domain-containing protein [Candidatus Poribacteria bacterium]